MDKSNTKNTKEIEIIDENNPLANSSLIPNIIDEMDLTPYAFRLYARFKRRVNQNRDGSTSGRCFETTRNLAMSCKMSPSQVTRSKRELVNAGLIRIEKEAGDHGEFSRDVVYILDIWKANTIFFSDRFVIFSINGDKLSGKDARRMLRENADLKRLIVDLIKKAV